jgi:putative DNA primase/helicase
MNERLAALRSSARRRHLGHLHPVPGPRPFGSRSVPECDAGTGAPDGFIVFSHAGDDWRDCRAHVLQRLGRQGERDQGGRHDRPAKRDRVAKPPAKSNSDLAVAIWKEGIDPRDTPVRRYLASRGLELPDEIAGRVVRFHPACPWQGERRPCMVMPFRSIENDRIVAIHRTLLSADGKKLDRKMLGPVSGAAIKIDADQDVEQGLMICEGFETGLAGRMLGLRPVWALGSAGAIGDFPVLPGIEILTVFAETDDSGANAKAVKTCGNRWAAAKREVMIATPYARGDMNDAVRT